MKKAKTMVYPADQGYRGGCKVGWLVFDSETDAQACSRAAAHNAVIREAQGYDFGYQRPGSIHKMANGQFEVCIP